MMAGVRKYGTPWEWVQAIFIIIGSLLVSALMLLFIVVPTIGYILSIFLPR